LVRGHWLPPSKKKKRHPSKWRANILHRGRLFSGLRRPTISALAPAAMCSYAPHFSPSSKRLIKNTPLASVFHTLHCRTECAPRHLRQGGNPVRRNAPSLDSKIRLTAGSQNYPKETRKIIRAPPAVQHRRFGRHFTSRSAASWSTRFRHNI